jgi:hypothetical protein
MSACRPHRRASAHDKPGTTVASAAAARQHPIYHRTVGYPRALVRLFQAQPDAGQATLMPMSEREPCARFMHSHAYFLTVRSTLSALMCSFFRCSGRKSDRRIRAGLVFAAVSARRVQIGRFCSALGFAVRGLRSGHALPAAVSCRCSSWAASLPRSRAALTGGKTTRAHSIQGCAGGYVMPGGVPRRCRGYRRPGPGRRCAGAWWRCRIRRRRGCRVRGPRSRRGIAARRRR